MSPGVVLGARRRVLAVDAPGTRLVGDDRSLLAPLGREAREIGRLLAPADDAVEPEPIAGAEGARFEVLPIEDD